MSIKLISLVFEKSKTKAEGRLVLLALADNASDEGYCFPNLKTLSKKANTDVRTTRAYLKALGALGVVKSQFRFESGRQTSNGYLIDKDKIGEDEISAELLKECKPASSRWEDEKDEDAQDDTLPPLSCDDTPPSPAMPSPPLSRQERPLTVISNRQSTSLQSGDCEREILPLLPLPEAQQTEAKPAVAKPESMGRKFYNRFLEITKAPAPHTKTEKEKKAAGQAWWNPIRRMVDDGGDDALLALDKAAAKMIKDGLTLRCPRSLEENFGSALAEIRRKKSPTTPALTPAAVVNQLAQKGHSLYGNE